jgi:hypothetical protein
MGLNEILVDLIKFPVGQKNVLSIYLDLRPDRSGKKLYPVYLKNQLSEIKKNFPPRAKEQVDLGHDIKLVYKFLDEELNPAWKGLAIYACSAVNLFVPLPMLQPPPNYISYAPFPHLFLLLLQTPLYQPHAVIVATSRQASLNLVRSGYLAKQLNFSWEDKHTTRFGRMGWSLPKFQRHLQEHLKQRSKEIVENLEKLIIPEKFEYLFVVAEEGIAGELQKQMPAALKKKWISLPNSDIHDPLPKILASATETLLNLFRSEAENLANYILAEAEPMGRAASGPERILSALPDHQIERMVLDKEFAASGWRCVKCFSLGFGGLPKACPYCAGSICATNLREEIVLKAKSQNIEILFTEKFPPLLKAGGVAALFKYKK